MVNDPVKLHRILCSTKKLPKQKNFAYKYAEKCIIAAAALECEKTCDHDTAHNGMC